MNTYAGALFIAGALFAGAVSASELKPMQGKSIMLGDVSGTAYYTVESDGFRVVATLASGETATPVRFVATLLPGQKTVFSVPREPGLSALTVEIARVGDRVHVASAEKMADLRAEAE